MYLSVKELELRKIRFDESFEPGKIDFTGEDLEQTGPLRATGTAELLEGTEGGIRLQGRYTVEMGAQCDRCLGRARFPLDATFDLFYQPAEDLVGEDEVEIDEGAAEIGFYEGSGLELEDTLREQVLLALPMQRVCDTACKGMCPVCGGNRNESSCGCETAPKDDRWSALRNLKS